MSDLREAIRDAIRDPILLYIERTFHMIASVESDELADLLADHVRDVLTERIEELRSGDGPKDYDEGPGYERALDDLLRVESSAPGSEER